MTYGVHHQLVGTCDQDYRVGVDTLNVPIAAGPAIGTVVGTLLKFVEKTNGVTLSGSTITVQMTEDYNFRPGTTVMPKATVEGGAAKWDCKLESWNDTTKRFVFRTYNAAGALAAPPAGATVHVTIIHRY